MEAFPLTSPAGIAVFLDLLTSGDSTRAQVGERTGISMGAVTKAVRPLLELGMLTEQRRTGESGPGRPVQPLRVVADWGHFAGVKLTDTEIIAALVDLTGAVVGGRHVPLPSPSPSDAVAAVADVLRELYADARIDADKVCAVGVAVSGDVEPRSGLVRFSPFLDWHDVPLADLLGEATGHPVVVENDVRALTVVETVLGAGVGRSSHAVVTVGSGIGCGITMNGRVLAGSFGVAGELGHLPLASPEINCYCGGQGCLEAAASVPAVLAQLTDALGRSVPSIAAAVAMTGDDGDLASVVLRDWARLLGAGLASLANLVGPQLIVLTGEEITGQRMFRDEVLSAFSRQAFGAAARCEVIVRPHPFEDWARGAAAVALQAYLGCDRDRWAFPRDT